MPRWPGHHHLGRSQKLVSEPIARPHPPAELVHTWIQQLQLLAFLVQGLTHPLPPETYAPVAARGSARGRATAHTPPKAGAAHSADRAPSSRTLRSAYRLTRSGLSGAPRRPRWGSRVSRFRMPAGALTEQPFRPSGPPAACARNPPPGRAICELDRPRSASG